MVSDDMELGILSTSKMKFDRFQIGAYDSDDNISALDNEQNIVDVVIRARLEISNAGCHLELAGTAEAIHLGFGGKTYVDSLEIKEADLGGLDECKCVLVLEVVDPPALKFVNACRLPFSFCKYCDWTAEIPKIERDISNSKKQIKHYQTDLKELDKEITSLSASIQDIERDILDGYSGTAKDRIANLPAELSSLDSLILQKEATHVALDLRAKLKCAVPSARDGLVGVAAELAKIDADSERVNSLQICLSAYLGPKLDALLFKSDHALNEFQELLRKQQKPQRRLGYSSQRLYDTDVKCPPKETSGYLGQVDAFLSVHDSSEARRFIKTLVGNLAVFSTYDSAQAYGRKVRKCGVSMVGLDQPRRIIRSDGGEYREYPHILVQAGIPPIVTHLHVSSRW